jgi:peptidoglycan L-alanyl-D-glutamate endopeptidase CwlK
MQKLFRSILVASYILEEMECYREADTIDSFIKTAAEPDIKDWFANPIEFDQDVEKYNASLIKKNQPAKPAAKPIPPKPLPIKPQIQPQKPINQPVVNKLPSTDIKKGDLEKSMDIMMKLEGGKSDLKSDRGGRTNLGVTQREFDKFRDKQGLPRKDVFNITKQEAQQIYKISYWDIIKGDELPLNVAHAMFSYALTDGPQDSVRFVQKLLGVEVTGFMGPKTKQAIWNACKNGDKKLTERILNKQIARYENDEQEQFKKGWVNRVKKLRQRIFPQKIVKKPVVPPKGIQVTNK